MILFLIGSLNAKFQPQKDLFTETILDEKDFTSLVNWKIDNDAEIKFGGLFQQERRRNFGAISFFKHKKSLNDIDFSATVKKENGSDDVEFGLIARYSKTTKSGMGGNFYYLLIKGNGKFAMGKYSDNNSWDNQVGWQNSTTIKQGNKLNSLRIVCNGKRVIGWINNQRVGMFEDDSYSAGQIGVMSVRGDSEAVGVYFDNILVKTKFQ